MPFERFHYHTFYQLNQELQNLGINLPLSENISILKQPLNFYGVTADNRLAIQPMEGCDGTANGAPDELTIRRYHRFARGGAGLIW